MSCKHCPYGLKAEDCKNGRICIRSELRAVIIVLVGSVAVAVISCMIGSEEVCNIGLIGTLVSIAGGLAVLFHAVALHLAENPHDPPDRPKGG